jgi:hypothetical protein
MNIIDKITATDYKKYMFILFVLGMFLENSNAADSLRIKKNYIVLNIDAVNTGNYIVAGSNIGLAYNRYLTRRFDIGTLLNCSFGKEYNAYTDVYPSSPVFAFKYKIAAEYKPLKNQNKILKIGMGFVVAKLMGGNAQVGITNNLTYQINKKKKAVIGIYIYNDIFLNKHIGSTYYPIDMVGFGFYFGGRF